MTAETVIELSRIRKSYFPGRPNEFEVLHGINLTIRRGEFVSIVGASGSGKSTLMNIIGILDRPSSGSYTLDGIAVDTLRDQELSRIRNRKIGFIFQNFNLIARSTAIHNVELPMLYAGVPRRERHERALELMAMVDMTDRAGISPMNCPAVRNSAWPSPGRWPMTHPSCWRMNRPAIWTL
jgi:putative ABC transport system ATP-binding protein